MIDVSNKIKTLRTARATGSIFLSSDIINRIKNKKIEKGDVLETARISGILAAKKNWELIPHCHQIPLDNVSIDFKLEKDHIEITSSVTAIAKTGVEMEALTAVSIAALNIYDMVKMYGSEARITDIRLIEKKGGKSDFKKDLEIKLNAAIVVCSDSTYQGKREDKSGLIIKENLSKYKNIKVKSYKILPDDINMIKNHVLSLANKNIDIVFITGGTGLGPRDVTVEAIREIADKEIPGISEAIRSFGQERTPYSMLSRGISALIKNSLVITLPGSSRGVKESLSALLPYVFHSFYMMRGGGH
jgi:cyclic pyranopterin phosphate synthase